MAWSTPKLVLKSAKAAATTYRFETEGEGFKSWALCTVNDHTGELLITSDWGNWSHRWNADALGVPTLTAFIGSRGGVDYLARKLQKEVGCGERFSSKKTALELKRLLCARRLEDGRKRLKNRLEPDDFDCGRLPNHYMDRYTEAGLPIFSDRIVRTVPAPNYYEPKHLPYLTSETARELWDALEALADQCDRSADLFWERLPAISGLTDYVTEDPWEHGMTEQTPEDQALRDIVLPALIEACKSTVKHQANLAKDDDARTDARRAFVAGFVASRPADGPLGQEAEDAFNRWWNDPSVTKAREERRKADS